MLQDKLRPLLVYKRQIIYFVYILSKCGMMFKLMKAQVESLKLSIKYIRECLETLVQVFFLSIKPILALEETVVSGIGETFRNLKAIG